MHRSLGVKSARHIGLALVGLLIPLGSSLFLSTPAYAQGCDTRCELNSITLCEECKTTRFSEECEPSDCDFCFDSPCTAPSPATGASIQRKGVRVPILQGAGLLAQRAGVSGAGGASAQVCAPNPAARSQVSEEAAPGNVTVVRLVART